MLHNTVYGWDIGGAHLKIAQASGSDSVTQVMQVVCPLWLGENELNRSINIIKDKVNLANGMHSVTMTGELVDYFDNRKDGVTRLVEKITKDLSAEGIQYYAGKGGFVSAKQAISNFELIASANWFASASYIAEKIENALFIDIGSTTSDIIAINNHQVIYDGYSDSERLYEKELVYCGVVRTPIFAICKEAPVENRFIPIINEYFANMADVYRLTNELSKHADIGEAADGRDKNERCSAVRIARMFGYDAKSEDLSIWREIAKYIREHQIQSIQNACRKRLFKTKLPTDAPIVGAGVGRFLAKEIAQRFNRKYIDFSSLVHSSNTELNIKIGDCAPAVSVACLGYQSFSE